MKKLTAGIVALSMLAFATPASAAMNLSGVFIGASNTGTITNVTTATANTGDNTAGGSRGGRGGNGGDVEANGLNSAGNNDKADAGNGGNGGDAGAGGLVETGDAYADAGSVNKLNSNDVSVNNGKGGMNLSLLGVGTTNAGAIVDVTGANADSGKNKARGSRGGRGGAGGDVESNGFNTGGNNQYADAGHGGEGGAGGLGGTIDTGDAHSNAGSINVMNTNVVRVRN